MLPKTLTISLLVFTLVVSISSEIIDFKQEECRSISSCSSCIQKSFCTWCVTKSKCTKQSCGNDNIIYPKDLPALMAGPQFCPRVVKPEQTLTIKSGAKEVIAVKITQIHLYMAFTPWKCKITFKDTAETKTLVAVLVGDTVYCEMMQFVNESNQPYRSGSVSVLWDYSKTFDGSLPFEVCNCDMDPTCNACNK